jgi:MlaA lipoprotein
VSRTRCRSDLWVAAVLVTLASITFLGCSVRREGPGEPDRQLSKVAPTDAEAEFRTTDATDAIDYDPWERFNEKTFWFNHDVLDRYALKPVATVWAKIPDSVRHGLANAFHNLAMPKRLVNEVFQASGQVPGSR